MCECEITNLIRNKNNLFEKKPLCIHDQHICNIYKANKYMTD